MNFNPDNIKVTSGREGSYKSSDVKGRPTSSPEGSKDFKKVLDKDDEKDENGASKEIIEEEDGVVLAMGEVKKKKPLLSLFNLPTEKKPPRVEPKIAQPEPDIDLATVPIKPNIKTPVEDSDLVITPEEGEEVAFADKPAKEKSLFSDIKPVKEQSNVKPMKQQPAIDEAPVAMENDQIIPIKPAEKEKFTTRFSTEQTDLSYVNPLAAQQQPSVNLSISTEKAIVPVKDLQAIIDQMISKVTEIKQSGKTETEVTLKYPPLFEGAKIVVTSFDSARNEFNISIENLKQQAKDLLDLKVNKDHLLLALEQKGYAVHILSTTTITENRITPPPLPQEQQFGRQGSQEREEQGKQQQQKRERNA